MSDNAQDTPDGDTLLVLTAAMLTPGGFPGLLGDDYPAACAHLGLEPLSAGYGLVFGQDSTGARWTVATTDAAMVACALAAWDCGLAYDLSPDEDTIIASLPGWPLPVAVAVPGVPAPHDPDEETAGRPALTPPDTSVWGPPQRRLGADEIAIRWRDWRDQIGPGTTGADSLGEPAFVEDDATPVPAAPDAAAREQTATPEAAPATAETTPAGAEPLTAGPLSAGAITAEPAAAIPASPQARTVGSDAEPAAKPTISHGGVRRALEGAEAYVRNPPPPGRVRTTYGAVRADGPGWSLVARTDDMAFVLLDDAPGEVLPVGRGPALPPLLEALSRLAGADVGAN
jgi:hypothetical protein